MAKIEFSARGFTETINKMRKRKENLSNFEPYHKKATIVVMAWIFRNFQRDGGLHDDKSLKWPVLSPATIARRKQGSPAILRDTGRLRTGFESRVNAFEAVLENKVKYAVYHEFGNFRGEKAAFIGPFQKGKNLPQRKMFPEPGQAEDIVHPVMVAHIKKGIK